MIKQSESQAMRYLIAAAALLMSTPVFADSLRCVTPPGSPAGTARWSSNGRIIEEYLITSDGNRYICGRDIVQNNPPRRVGNKRYSKQACGPLTIVREETYRPCTLEESAGINSRYDLSSRLSGLHSKSMCIAFSYVTSDIRYELRDKDGQKFQLGTEHGFTDRGNSEFSDTCTSSVKRQSYTKSWRVGSTNKEISLTRVTEYQAESIMQPSL
jgi:hypothetical protein